MIDLSDRLTEAVVMSFALIGVSFLVAFALAVVGTLLVNVLMGAVWVAQRMRQAFASWKARR